MHHVWISSSAISLLKFSVFGLDTLNVLSCAFVIIALHHTDILQETVLLVVLS